MGLCAAAGFIVLGINLFYMVKENSMRVQFYGSQIDGQMAQKAALIEGSYDGGNYVFLTTKDGLILTHPDQDLALQVEQSTTVADALSGQYAKVCEDVLSTKLIWDYAGGLKFAISSPVETTGWDIVAVTSLSGVLVVVLVTVVLTAVLCFALSSIVKRQLTKGISPMFMPLEELAENVSKISEGQLDYHFGVDEQSQEVNALSVALNDTMQNLEHYITEISDTVTAISEKNLDFDVDGVYAGDYEKIKNALVDIVDALNQSFAEINEQASMVLQFSKDLSATSESVAMAATTQNASVLSASEEMGTLTDNMEKIADSAEHSAGNTAMVDEIVSFVDTQKNSADGILENIRSVSGMVESNAASAQENAAISASLGECAQSLMDTVAQFKLKQS